METKQKLTPEQTADLIKQAHFHLFNAIETMDDMFTQIKQRVYTKINYHLRNGDLYFHGTMRFLDGRPFILNETCDPTVYEDLAPYCYNKVNELLKNRKIRFEDQKFKIIE